MTATQTATTSTESALSMNWRLIDPEGIECQFTLRATQKPETLEEALDHIDVRSKLVQSMLAEGWKAAPTFSRGGAAPAVADPNARTCKHGLRVRKSGNSAKGAWVGHMCPLRKEDPDRCKPDFE